MNWCRCRWDNGAKQSLKLAASELVSVPFGLQRKAKSQAGRQRNGVVLLGLKSEAKSQAGRQWSGVGAVGTSARRKSQAGRQWAGVGAVGTREEIRILQDWAFPSGVTTATLTIVPIGRHGGP